MNKREQYIQEVREGIAEILGQDFEVDLTRKLGFTEARLRRASKILSDPRIALVDPEQELPLVSLLEAKGHDEKWAQSNFTDSLQEFGKQKMKDLTEDNWLKIIPPEEYIKEV